MKRALIWAAAGAILVANSTISIAAPVVVHVYNFDFSTGPSGSPVVDPTINVGETVRWVWDSGFHSVQSIAGSAEVWNSPVTSTVGFTFDHTFNAPGMFPYHCSIHAGMVGTVVVQ